MPKKSVLFNDGGDNPFDFSERGVDFGDTTTAMATADDAAAICDSCGTSR